MVNIIAQDSLSHSRRSAHPQNDLWYLSTHPKWGNIDNGYQRLDHFAKKSVHQGLSAVSQDLLNVAAFLYTADKLVVRRPWMRDLHFQIPVREKERWDRCREFLVDTISRLSGDNVSFEFLQSELSLEAEAEPPHERPQEKGDLSEEKGELNHRKDCVALFSGGLDSFAGLVKLTLAEGRNPLLVSHSPGPIGGVQRNLLKGFISNANLQELKENDLIQLALGPRRNAPHNPVTNQGLGYGATPEVQIRKMENTQRMRSFLHLSLATVIAQQAGLSDVFIIDNGILSINLPLVSCRGGSRSTRSTDPLFLKLYQDFASKLYGSKLNIQNPFLFKTKAQIVDLLQDYGQEKLIGDTVSCWAYPRGLRGLERDAQEMSKPVRHCGYCLPCLVRRMAILSCGLADYDGGYAKDVMVNFGKAHYQPGGVDYPKSENFRDLLYFCTHIQNIRQDAAKIAKQTKSDLHAQERAMFLTNYPELSILPDSVRTEGGKNPIQEAIDMYSRFSNEVLDVVRAYGDEAVKSWII